MSRTLAILALVICSATASALVTRATYLKKAAFRDAAQICLTPIAPGAGQPVSAFNASVIVCPRVDETEIESPAGQPCETVNVANVAATPGQKNWVKGIWSAALVQSQVPEAAVDAP